MRPVKELNQRRNFIRTSGILGAGLFIPKFISAESPSWVPNDNIHQFGKREGYTDQISILISMMDWMRMVVMRSVEGLSQMDIDFLLDDESNSIGAMLMHLTATERYYQINTFSGVPESDLSFDVADNEWEAASQLGNAGRKIFKEKPLTYYQDKLEEVRQYSLNELKNREDTWLMESTNFFGNQQTNNYCKWFHVVEHESNHNGQIKYIKSRLV